MFDKSDLPLLFCAVLGVGLLSLASQSGAPEFDAPLAINMENLPDIPVPEDFGGAPVQSDMPTYTVDLGHGFQAELIHTYAIDGLVVTQRVHRDAVGQISPLDLGIVWGEMALDGRAEAIQFTAGRRRVNFRADDTAAFPPNWQDHVTNNHLIPVSEVVRHALMEVEVGQHVQITGYLVNVTGDSISTWRTSTERSDGSLIDGCEIILVQSVNVINESV